MSLLFYFCASYAVIIAGFCVLCRWNYIKPCEEGSLGVVIWTALFVSLLIAFCNREPQKLGATREVETQAEEYMGKGYKQQYYRNMKVSFLGDIHGKWELIPKGMPYPIIQVGDLGIGFKIHIIGKGIVPDPEHFTDNFFFIRGNHDNPEECGFRPECLGDYGSTVFTNNKGEHTTPVFYVAGGFSVDRNLRVQGLDWWPEKN